MEYLAKRICHEDGSTCAFITNVNNVIFVPETRFYTLPARLKDLLRAIARILFRAVRYSGHRTVDFRCRVELRPLGVASVKGQVEPFPHEIRS